MPVDALTTDGGTTGTNSLARMRRYRLLFYGALGLGLVGFLGAALLDRVAVGVGVLWLGVVAALGLWRATDVQLFDERDRDLEARASYYTVMFLGLLTVFAVPGALLVEVLGYATVPPEATGALLALGGLCFVYVLSYGAVR